MTAAETAGTVNALSITNAGTGYTNGTYTFEPLTGGSGTGATATVVISGGSAISVVLKDKGQNYTVGDLLSAAIPGGTGLEFTVGATADFVSL